MANIPQTRIAKLKRLRYIAWKYWRMNPYRFWWVLHVYDEIRSWKPKEGA